MKQNLYSFLVLIISLLAFANLKGQRTYVITDFNVPVYNAEVSNSIPVGTGNSTWTRSNTYILDGQVFVNPGDILTIEDGTLIKGRHNGGDASQTAALIVSRGADIQARGTASRPIIFTSEGDDITRSGSSSCPNAEVAFLSDLQNLVTAAEQPPRQGPIEWDAANGEGDEVGGPQIQMNGKLYDKGIGMHSSHPEREPSDPEVSRVVFDLSGQSYDVFKADIGLQDEKLIDPNTDSVSAISVEFVVRVDGEVRYDSDLMVAGSRIQYVEVNVSNASTLELILENGGDYGINFSRVSGNRKNSDHGNWGNARLERCISSGSQQPSENQDPGAFDKGLWGGIMVLGSASVNNSTPLNEVSGDSFSRGSYGGNSDTDNSGILQYVSIRHGGALFSTNPSRRYNGLSLVGVGSGTTIDHVEVYAHVADAFKFIGGTVNTKHLAASFCDDVSFDSDFGFRGKGQFWFTLQNSDSRKAGEHDGSSESNTLTAQPFSNSEIYNASFFGADNGNTTDSRYLPVAFQRNGAGMYKNSIFADFGQGVIIDWNNTGNTSYDRFEERELTFENNIFWNISSASEGTGEELFNLFPRDATSTADLAAAEANFARSFGEGGNIYNSPEFRALNSNSRTAGAQAFDPRPRIDGLGFATDDFASYPSGSFFETVTYKGAFGNTLWLANWTALDAYGFLGSNGGNTNGTPRLPDLRFSTTNQASLPDEIGISDSLTFTFTIQNAGDFPSEGTRVRIRQGNQELLSETVSFLEVGGNVAFSFKVLGTDLGLGSHVLTVEIDPDQEIREQNESNNSFSHTVQVVDDTPTFPDIVLTNLQVSANTAFVEQSLLLTFDIANLGDAISETVSITVTLGGESLTPTPGTLPALTIGESRSSSVEVTIPPGTTLGEKVLTLTLSEPNETNTTNNTGTVNVEIIERPPTGPDLTINSISVDSSQICRGNILMVMMEIENIGDENAGNFLIGVTLGDNPISPDPSLFTAGVAAGSSQTFNTALVIPANEPVGTSQLIITLFLNADIEPGNNSDSISITIKNCDQEPPTCDFTLTEASDLFHSVGQGATSQPSIQVSDVSQVEQVNFLYRHISSFDEIFTVQPLTSNGNTYTASLSDSDFGPVGISYRFQVLATGCEDKVESGHIYLSYSDPGLSLPSIPAGSAQPDYRMIAVPLSLNSRGFLDTFGDELQDDEGKTRWRFMRFNGSSTIDHTGTIDPGLGYWILSTSPLSLQTDAGTTVQVTEDSPFSFNLTSGGTFTQIGNPYNFPVSWEDVLTENATSRSLVKLLTYSRGWDSLEVLSPFQGAFIQNNAGLSRIQVPVKRNPNVNRLAAGEPLPALDAENWKVGIELKTQDLVHKVSAFGMHSKAIEGRDALDMQGLPRFSTFLDLNFPLEDSPNKSFRENYVNTQDSYTWNMEVQSSDKGVIEVSWENAYFGNNTKELWLENLQTGQVIDMRLKKTAYVRSSGQENVFRIHFGPLEYVQAQIQQSTPWIGEPFPNPFTNKLAFELFIPNSGGKAKVEGELFNLIGQKVTEKVWHLDSNHPNQLLKWDVSSQLHTKGVYLYKLRVSSNFISQDKIGSVIFIE